MRSIVISSSTQRKCTVKLADDFSDLVREATHIVDSGVAKKIAQILPTPFHTIQGGEQAKSIDHVFELYQLFKTKGNRHVYGIGGGSLVGMVSFAATTHTQIEELKLFPTTPVAQAMPPIGGRFTINYEFVKNVLEASGLPTSLVVIPSASYELLEKNGISELLAPMLVSMSFDPRLFSYMRNVSSNGQITADTWGDIIWASLKAYVGGVEKGCRVIGESMADAIQSSLRLQIGYSVALAFGSLLEIWLASSLELMSESTAREYSGLILSIWSKKWPARLDMSSLTDYIGQREMLEFAYPQDGKTQNHRFSSREFKRIIRGTRAGRMERFT
ncbi:MAG TPA: hypothetical protein DCE14_08225 [Kosmotogaceae bacterium]|nr:MAG: 3-dehydroquinate synthase [Thermotogales bacterium 46_20]HAA86311.1 hypothetical protein [Kosmotogaceae bacterium]